MDYRAHCVRALTAATLVAGMCAGSSALAVMPPAEIYSTAEKWFHSLETQQGYTPTAPVTLLDDGYYHRCYDNGTCFGVSLDTQDGVTYKKQGDNAWERLGTLEELLPSLPSMLVRELGTIDGDLAEDMRYEVEPAKKASLGAALRKTPLVLGGKKLTRAADHRARHVFKADVPLAMLNASAQEVERLRKDVGVKGMAALPAGLETVEAYGIDRDTEGNVYELMVLPPPTTLPEASVDVYTGDATTGATITTTHQEAAPFADSDPLRSIRTEELIEWLRDDEARDRTAQQRAAAGRAVLEADDQFKNLQDVVRSYESRMVFPFRKNVHALTTNVWTVHNNELNEDWFYVRQQGIFSAANELLPLALVNNISPTEGNDRGRFTDLYNITTFVDGYAGNPAVFLDQSSPITTTGVTKISSSVSWNLSGKLSGAAKCTSDNKCEIGGGAEITGGVSVNNSYSYDIPDVTVRNQSGTNLNNASWDFAIAWPAWTNGFGCIGFSGLGPLAAVSGSTFQPITQWIWRVGSAVRSSRPAGLPITVNFRTRVRHIYYGPFCNFNMTNWNQESDVLVSNMLVPWPPNK
jgi:hypothetical protein